METQTSLLFEMCDSDNKGFLTKDDLKVACPQLSNDEIVFIFSCLDTNNSGTIDKSEFCAGFEETLFKGQSSGFDGIQNRVSSGDNNGYGRQDAVVHHQEVLVDGLLDANSYYDRKTKPTVKGKLNRRDTSRKISPKPQLALDIPCKDEVLQLYQELQSSGVPQIMSKFEEVVGNLCREIDQKREENELLQNMQKAERDNYNRRMNEIENEIDQQLMMAETKAREEERQRLTKEKQELKEKLESEMKELQSNIEHLQKMEKVLKKESKSGNGTAEQKDQFKEKLDEIARENRTLKNSLADNHLEMTLIKAELSELKCEYEAKTMELMTEKHETMAEADETENIQRQLQLLYDANKRLHETNDNLRGALDTRTNIMKQIHMQNSFAGPSAFGSPLLPLPRSISTLPYNSSCHSSMHSFHGDTPTSTGLDDDDRDSGFPTDHSRSRRCGSSRTSISDADLFRCASVDTTGKDSHANSSGYSSTLVEFTGPPDRTFRVVMCGDASVGKSSIIMRIVKGTYQKNIASTLGVDFHVKSIKMGKTNVAVQLWDTAGQERFRSLCNSYFRRADGAILVYDCSVERSFLRIRDWIETVRESASKPVPVLIVGNKIDLRDQGQEAHTSSFPDTKGENLAEILNDTSTASSFAHPGQLFSTDCNYVTQKDGQNLAELLQTEFIECSALDGTNIDAALLLLVG
uniref:EF-hand domain-containing protein n=1 Tax=Ditylenchus dipsaci TaxID=166011 RepID=A0A915EEU7_9BILA